MKILMTGFTALQVNTDKRPIQKIDVPAAIVTGLVELGHEVEWRKVEIGERLDHDLLVVNLAPMNSLNGRKGAFGALWAISRGGPTIMHFDDWQVSQVFNAARNCAKIADRQFYKKLPGGENFYAWDDAKAVKQNHALFVRVLTSLLEPWRRWVALCPMYEFGDKRIVKRVLRPWVPENLFTFVDPSARVVDLDWKSARSVEKQRRWALASLMPHDYWLDRQHLRWPVDLYGNRTIIKERGGERLATEAEVRERYLERWGILAPPYPQAGSGWFRSRFIYAAQTGAVLGCDAKDGDGIDLAYYKTLDGIERRSDAELEELAQEQREFVWPRLWTHKRFNERLAEIVQLAQEVA